MREGQGRARIAIEQTLESARLVLRRARLHDHPEWAALRSQSRAFLQTWEPDWREDELSRANFRRKLRRYEDDAEAGRAFAFLSWRKGDRALLGGITLGQIRRGAAQTAMLGYWIGAPFARQGYTLEAARAVLHLAFGALDLHRVEACCMPENTASLGVLSQLGFQQEGRLRQALHIAGAWRDHVLLSLLREEFDAVPAIR